MTFKKDLSLFFNYIKTSNENKVYFPPKIKYIKLKKILQILLIYGIILNFGVVNNKLYVYPNKQPILHIYWLKKSKYYSIYKLKALFSKYPDNIYVVSTHIGILDSKSLIKLNLGGYLLFALKTKASLLF